MTTNKTILRFTVFSFPGKLIFNGVQGHSYNSIKIAIFKPQRRLAQHETLLVVSPGSLHMNMSTENIVCVDRVC